MFSITNALRKFGLETNIATSADDLRNLDAIVLPGVGNFKAGARNIQTLRKDILKSIELGVPLFGICLGMQLLFDFSEESKGKGLGLLKGKVVRLPLTVKTPHMGWNTLKIVKDNDLLNGIDEDHYFYFVHSYYSSPVNDELTVAKTDYGVSFASVVACGNIMATQFHPEKSGKSGDIVLNNFSEIIKK